MIWIAEITEHCQMGGAVFMDGLYKCIIESKFAGHKYTTNLSLYLSISPSDCLCVLILKSYILFNSLMFYFFFFNYIIIHTSIWTKLAITTYCDGFNFKIPILPRQCNTTFHRFQHIAYFGDKTASLHQVKWHC